MFDYYLIGSPSLWCGNKMIFAMEAEYANKNNDLKAKVFMAAGEQEQDSEFNMLKNMFALDAKLQARHYPGLTIKTQSIADQDHLSVYRRLSRKDCFGRCR